MSHESIRPVPDIKNDIKKPEFESFNIARAYYSAQKAHEGQLRKSGEPYFTHCEAVYEILKKWGVKDEACLIAALLHDTIEDTETTFEQIDSAFGNEVAKLVFGVTNLKTSNDRENLKKVIKESYIDPREGITKLGDRLDNMRTIKHVEPVKQINKAMETLDVYPKLAESLGIWSAKTELEDLCFEILYPKKYDKTLKKLARDKRLNPDFGDNLKKDIEELLFDNNIYGKVEKKKGGLWTSVKKREKLALEGKGMIDSFENVDDVFSIRVQLDCVEDCYKIIPKINSKFEGMVDFDRFDQFIGANKRLNGYQALHITVNFPEGPVKIAIMTKEMEEFNKWGVINLINSKKEKEIRDNALKLVFTPTGNIRFLTEKATGFDFACSISPRVFAEAESINIDGINYPLSTVIPNASTVEVVIGKSRIAPPKGTEKFTTMPETKRKIKDLRILEEKDNLIKKGQIKLESILKPRGLLVLSDLGNSINHFLYGLGCEGFDNFYFKIGNGSITKDSLNTELDMAGITKEKLKITSIRLKGVDQPGILASVSERIRASNKNIFTTNQIIEKDSSGTRFDIRILVKYMSKKDERELKKYLLDKEIFSEVVVV